MGTFILRLLVNAVALWLTTLIVAGVSVLPYDDTQLATVLTYLLVALVFGLVNTFIGTAVRVVAFPLYILTLGLLSLVVNALLLMLAAWVTSLFGFGLVVEDFWWGVLGALVLSILSGLLNLILRPLMRKPGTDVR
jgi:putative membrane protein